ncbi:deoxyribodipyrimidine photo-lyase [bacterium]|nr:deoxyribodipyrimidine photo-lyase [bacterium]
MVQSARISSLNAIPARPGPVVYWMSRDQRARDNWALLYAQEKAVEFRAPLHVVFCLVPEFLGALDRQYRFMLHGLRQTAADLSGLHIPFRLEEGEPRERIPAFLDRVGAGMLVTDFDPLKIKRAWKQQVLESITVCAREVDTHNIVPCRAASDKQEWAAYTIRKKITLKLPDFLEPFPSLIDHPFPADPAGAGLERPLKAHPDSGMNTGGDIVVPGEAAARACLDTFITERLDGYPENRNNPLIDGTSNLSPYLHFGQIAPQRVAWEVQQSRANPAAKEAFLEELIVRRELADNYCWYNREYDTVNGFPDWARATLADHRHDQREYIYSPEQFERAQTHDALWNAAQTGLTATGTMHGYLRMYWAKKILEWTPSPEEALAIAISLNDRYQLDGRDPNGYTGVAWSIGGVHDRAWPERSVFGKIRFMNASGCRRKFDVDGYIDSKMNYRG